MKHKLFTKNFTLLILGQASSLFGNYILRLALSMYVLDATGSATVFAGILSLAVVPSILLSPLGGILTDRADKRKVMAALDILTSITFITKERTDILKLLLLAACSRFFVMGVTLVGLPFLVRTLLSLDAKYYGAAESALAIATIAGSIAAGLLTGKLRFRSLSLALAAIGMCMLPAGIIFFSGVDTVVKYAVNITAFCGMQIAVSIFSIFAVSMIQQNTPDHLIGR